MKFSFPNNLFRTPPKLQIDGVLYPASEESAGPHEEMYIRLRRQEGHLLTDKQVLNLPHAAPHPSLRNLWKMRKQSAEKVTEHLLSKGRELTLLDLGCGNGWFSQSLALIPGSKVLAMDLNLTEVRQARRIFQQPNLCFAFADIEKKVLNECVFDAIVLNASVQYFQSVYQLLTLLRTLLKVDGEIHLLDSPFYNTQNDQLNARETSRIYFESMGEPGMISHYHHFLWSDLTLFDPEIHRFDGNLLKKLVRIPQNPMPWIIIRK